MDDWKLIWNSFCDEVTASVQKNNLEKVFEEDIARDFFTTPSRQASRTWRHS